MLLLNDVTGHENSWYSLTHCEYPDGQWRLRQHTIIGCSVYIDDSITTTNICEGRYDALLDVAKRGGLDVYTE